jgi:hypothetical protein
MVGAASPRPPDLYHFKERTTRSPCPRSEAFPQYLRRPFDRAVQLGKTLAEYVPMLAPNGSKMFHSVAQALSVELPELTRSSVRRVRLECPNLRTGVDFLPPLR